MTLSSILSVIYIICVFFIICIIAWLVTSPLYSLYCWIYNKLEKLEQK